MSEEDPVKYSFCESVYAGPCSPWHIRRLTDQGRKPGGGIDTESLCGLVKPPAGWDVSAPITKHHLDHCCKKCLVHYPIPKEVA